MTKCPRDETAGDEVSPRQNGRRRNGSDETAATKGGVPFDLYTTFAVILHSTQYHTTIALKFCITNNILHSINTTTVRKIKSCVARDTHDTHDEMFCYTLAKYLKPIGHTVVAFFSGIQ